jgi:hypothetical protein
MIILFETVRGRLACCSRPATVSGHRSRDKTPTARRSPAGPLACVRGTSGFGWRVVGRHARIRSALVPHDHPVGVGHAWHGALAHERDAVEEPDHVLAGRDVAPDEIRLAVGVDIGRRARQEAAQTNRDRPGVGRGGPCMSFAAGIRTQARPGPAGSTGCLVGAVGCWWCARRDSNTRPPVQAPTFRSHLAFDDSLMYLPSSLSSLPRAFFSASAANVPWTPAIFVWSSGTGPATCSYVTLIGGNV